MTSRTLTTLPALFFLAVLSGCVSTAPSNIHLISPNMNTEDGWKEEVVTVRACTKTFFHLFSSGNRSYTLLLNKLPASTPERKLSYLVEDVQIKTFLHLKTTTCTILQAHYLVSDTSKAASTAIRAVEAPVADASPEGVEEGGGE